MDRFLFRLPPSDEHELNENLEASAERFDAQIQAALEKVESVELEDGVLRLKNRLTAKDAKSAKVLRNRLRVLVLLMNGGPGSGRYPRGSGEGGESKHWITKKEGKAIVTKPHDEALTKKGFKGVREYRKVDSNQAARLKKATGQDLSKYSHGVDADSIRHGYSSHGNEKKEAARGQVAVKKKDFEALPGLVSDPKTKISMDTPTKQGLQTIRYEWARKNLTVLVEEIRKQHLVPKSIMIQKIKRQKIESRRAMHPV
jgi:hypothetical protein